MFNNSNLIHITILTRFIARTIQTFIAVGAVRYWFRLIKNLAISSRDLLIWPLTSTRRFEAQGLEDVSLDSRLGMVVANREDQSSSQRSSSSLIDTQSIDERGWLLAETVLRPSLVDTITWATSDAPGSVLATYELPRDLIVNQLNDAPFSTFKYWRGDISLSFQVNASPMHQGIVKAVFIPLTYSTSALQRLNPLDISINEHVSLYANTSSPANLTIPYLSPLNYLDVRIPGDELASSLGTLYFVVWNQLEAATNSSLIATISVMASLPNSEFKVPRLKPYTRLSKQVPRVKFEAQFFGGLKSLITPLTDIAASGISSVTGGLIPKKFISDGIDIVRGLTGLDKPSNYMVSAPTSHVSVGRLNNAVGEVYLDKLTPFPAEVAALNSSDISSRADEMSFAYLLTKSSYLGSFTVSTAQVPGDVLAYFPVNPICTDIGKLTYQPTLLGYVSMPFQFWQGSLKFKFEVSATSLQTTKLFVAFNPGVFTPQTTLDIQTISAQYGRTIDIAQGSNSFEFEVPYIAPTPFLEVPHSNDTTQGVTTLNSVGMLHVVVLNRLVCPNNVPTSIAVNVYISGGDNFILRGLSTANLWTPIEPAPIGKSEFEAQMMAVEPLQSEVVEEKVISDPIPVSKDAIGNSKEGTINPGISLSTRDYLKKYQLVYRDVRLQLPYFKRKIDLRDLVSIEDNVRSTGLLEWFTAPYRCIHGGLRFNISFNGSFSNAALFQSICSQFRVYYLPPLSNTGGYNAITLQFLETFQETADPLLNVTRLNVSMINTIDRTLHFEVPYQVLLNFNLTKDEIDLAYATSHYTDMGSILMFADGIEGQLQPDDMTITVHVAYADETRAFYLYKVPLLGRSDIYYPDQWEGTTLNNLTPVF